MTEPNSNTLLVELFLSHGRVHGLTHEVVERKRLVDVLCDGNPALRIESAKVVLSTSPSGRQFSTINIEKRSILAAIPHETQSQQRVRSVLTSTVGKNQTRTIQVTLLLPPFVVEGSLHVPASVANIGDRISADVQIFGSFISVTGATLLLPGGTEVDAPVLLVNRDLIAGISVAEAKRTSERSQLETTWPSLD